jgi:hypothetical protein
VAHENPITPSGTSGLHVAARPSLVLLEGVARRKRDGEFKKLLGERMQLFVEFPELNNLLFNTLMYGFLPATRTHSPFLSMKILWWAEWLNSFLPRLNTT